MFSDLKTTGSWLSSYCQLPHSGHFVGVVAGAGKISHGLTPLSEVHGLGHGDTGRLDHGSLRGRGGGGHHLFQGDACLVPSVL